MITPRRIVFEGKTKLQELNLANTGKDTARYLISMLEIRMKPDGGFDMITLPDSGQNFASSFVRFFPRTVVLPPLEAQVIKIQVTRQSQLQPGEYRSHIYLRAVPNEKPLGDTTTAPIDSTGISVKINTVFGISIPVIIRVGESTSAVDISNTAFRIADDKTPVMNMVFHRTGNMSVYGTVRIDFVTPLGKSIKVAEIKGVAVYTPTASRSISIALNNNLGIDYRTGKLHVVYKTEADLKSLTIAETELALH